jgi:DNA-binding MarR family transcriptional regulator
METDSLLKLENQVCFALYSLAREVTKLYHPLLQDIGLTYTQYITMMALWEEDRTSVKDLGSRLHLDSGTLTPLLKKLEKMDLITRARDKRDERSVVIELTASGKALREKAKDIPMRLYGRTGMSAEEAAELRNRLEETMHRLQGTLSVAEPAQERDKGGK